MPDRFEPLHSLRRRATSTCAIAVVLTGCLTAHASAQLSRGARSGVVPPGPGRAPPPPHLHRARWGGGGGPPPPPRGGASPAVTTAAAAAKPASTTVASATKPVAEPAGAPAPVTTA